jgi:hypothetical protein
VENVITGKLLSCWSHHLLSANKQVLEKKILNGLLTFIVLHVHSAQPVFIKAPFRSSCRKVYLDMLGTWGLKFVPGFRISIDLMRIRMQFRIQGFDEQKLKKFTTDFFFF